jgi:hypothetical protein
MGCGLRAYGPEEDDQVSDVVVVDGERECLFNNFLSEAGEEERELGQFLNHSV